ncbi:MAG: Maf family protein, partial [Kiritimatiellae bacterium]|nr:Maf family protein [Kiritimatiellia bacterium]
APQILVEASSVRFKPFSRADAEAYFELANPLDRAGSYDIDTYGDRLVASITGSYTNVMGLPAEAVAPWLAAHSAGLSALPPRDAGEFLRGARRFG